MNNEHSPASLPNIDALRRKINNALAAKVASNEPFVLTVTEKLSDVTVHDKSALCRALAYYAHAEASEVPRAFWSAPDPALIFVAIGEATRISGQGSRRFEQVRDAHRQLMQHYVAVHPELPPSDEAFRAGAPTLIGGFSFFSGDRHRSQRAASDDVWADFEDASFVLADTVIVVDTHGTWVTFQFALTADEAATGERIARRVTAMYEKHIVPVNMEAPTPAPATVKTVFADDYDEAAARNQWRGLVNDAVEAINGGVMTKVVVARDVNVRGEGDFRASAVLRALSQSFPACFLFAFTRGGHTFVGGTPERLAALTGRDVLVTCLAGSAPRGASTEEDDRIGETLLHDPKNLFEHQLVIDMVSRTLSPTVDLRIPSAPALLKLENVQHLYTPVTGTLRPGGSPSANQTVDTDIITIVEQLHATPAVGGDPQLEAEAWLKAEEPLHRGWYAAPVGWIGPRGDGEFAVALRSGVIAGNRAKLFAGCGIVSRSEPDAEFAESALKLNPMWQALERSQ